MAMAAASPWTEIAPSSASTLRSMSSSLQAHLCVWSRNRTSYAPSLLPPSPPHWKLHRRSPAASSLRNGRGSARASRRASIVAMAFVQEEQATVGLKEFLEDLKAVGRVRLIVNTGVAVLESVTNLDKLFYHTLPGRGEYANLMLKEDNVDFHLLIDQVASAKLVTGKSSRGDIPTYMIRFVDNSDAVAVSLLVMWQPGTDGTYDNGQVDAFQRLLGKYGAEIAFAKIESSATQT